MCHPCVPPSSVLAVRSQLSANDLPLTTACDGHLNTLLLAHAMHACNALFEHCGIPWLVHIDHGCSVLKIKPDAARIGGKECPAFRIVPKAFNQLAALLRWDAAVEQYVAPTA